MLVEIKDETFLDLIVGENKKLLNSVIRMRRHSEVDLQNMMASGIALGLVLVKANAEERKTMYEIMQTVSARIDEEENKEMGQVE